MRRATVGLRVRWPPVDGIEQLMQPGDDGADVLRRMLQRPPWHADALCREYPEVNFFPSTGEDLRPAKSICRQCSVRVECEDYAMRDPDAYGAGIWGGTSPRERRVIRQGNAA